MDSHEVRTGARGETIRTVGWASKLRLGLRDNCADEGICADLDNPGQASGERGVTCRWSGVASAAQSVGAEVLAVVRSLLRRAEGVEARIRVEIDPAAARIAAGPIGTVLYGMLRRAIEAYGAGSSGTPPENAEIALCVRLDGSTLRLHVLDGAFAESVPAAQAALGLSAATAMSLGGSLDISSIPFGSGTLTSAAIPVARLMYQSEGAA